MKTTDYITTPIYYASGRVHIGNSYSTLASDAFARHLRLSGHDVYFLTGMDEHGQKIENAALKEQIPPQAFVDKVAEDTKKTWNALAITNDDFIRTTDVRHVKIVQKIFSKLLASGDIYPGVYTGDYCVPCEAFFTKTQMTKPGICPDCGRPTIKVEEEAYFLKLKKYEKTLLDYILSHDDFILPVARRNEVTAFIKQGLEDLCVSRTSFKWGIPVLENSGHVIYVWIDALSNYLTALGYLTEDDAKYQKYWVRGNNVFHIIGKDILRFHAVYWPIMLFALGVPVNFHLYVHGWINMKEGKMSKSKGNIVYPEEVISRFGLDALRYYLLKEMPFGDDGIFSWEMFKLRYNADLANDLGNLVQRTIAMLGKYFRGSVRIPKTPDDDFVLLLEKTKKDALASFDSFLFQAGIASVNELIRFLNRYIDMQAPWVLAKDESKRSVLEDVMYQTAEGIRFIGTLLSCIMPHASGIILAELGIPEDKRGYGELKYGYFPVINATLKPQVLFQRISREI